MRIMARTNERTDGYCVAFEITSQTAIATDPGELLSTIHRLGNTSKPAASDRFTICSLHAPVRQTTSAIFSPAYPPSLRYMLRDEGFQQVFHLVCYNPPPCFTFRPLDHAPHLR